ncbi:hypothetical protein GCM10010274_12130 [Streptomyces lavendofoliae]|uniref:Uncharacterized protein n=1 Tax=Streptomyces lavendofoliae TaxID=67314 RepID=A0A918HVL9_9ACTN|nr:hypothetical protein GCM10010274_12130 [Streptomyces lavendofoliae]
MEGARAGEAFGEFVQRGEVGDPARQLVLDHRAGCDGWGREAVQGLRSVRGRRNSWIDSSHFRQVRGAHGSRVFDGRVSLDSIANPHVNLRRCHCNHIYTHK